MSYTLKLEHPQFTEGTEFSVNGLPALPNGETVEIDEEAERTFMALNHRTLEDAFKDSAGFTLSGSSALSEDEQKSYLPAPTIGEPISVPEVVVDTPPQTNGEN